MRKTKRKIILRFIHNCFCALSDVIYRTRKIQRFFRDTEIQTLGIENQNLCSRSSDFGGFFSFTFPLFFPPIRARELGAILIITTVRWFRFLHFPLLFPSLTCTRVRSNHHHHRSVDLVVQNVRPVQR